MACAAAGPIMSGVEPSALAESRYSQDAVSWFRSEVEKQLPILRPVVSRIYPWIFTPAERAYERILGSEEPFFTAALKAFRLDYQCAPSALLNIPRTGPVILVANHPYGGIEGLLLGAMLIGIRKDLKFLATSVAMVVPPVREFVIPVHRQGKPQRADAHDSPVRAALRWLRLGGVVVVFPAGMSANRPAPKFNLIEQPWTDGPTVMARRSGAVVVPVFLHGCDHWIFSVASLLHPDLRYMDWIGQTLRRKRRVVRISIGKPVPREALLKQPGLKQATAYLRSLTLGLGAEAAE